MCAANGGNTQRWRFLVVKDKAIKQAVQVLYKRAFDEVVGPRYRNSAPPPGVTAERYQRQHAAVEYLTEHFHEAPVWIVACLEDASPTRWSGASIYPAVQNMLLAARALGLGATLTTRHLLHEKETEAALGLPPGVHSYAIIPIGYPMGRFGPVGRGAAQGCGVPGPLGSAVRRRDIVVSCPRSSPLFAADGGDEQATENKMRREVRTPASRATPGAGRRRSSPG